MEPVRATTPWAPIMAFGTWARIESGVLMLAPMTIGELDASTLDEGEIHEAMFVERSFYERLRATWPGLTWSRIPVIEDGEA